jgi:hypothetical protein
VPEHRYDRRRPRPRTSRRLAEAAGGPPSPLCRPSRQSGTPLVGALIALGALLAAGVLAAGCSGDDRRRPHDRPKTVKETVTLPGQTVVKTVTTEPPTTHPRQRLRRQSIRSEQPGFELMKAGNYEALPCSNRRRRAVGSETSPRPTRATTSRSRGSPRPLRRVAELLDRSEQIQGKRKEISKLRHEAKKGCGDER